jgi:sensor histidine kinase YesM
MKKSPWKTIRNLGVILLISVGFTFFFAGWDSSLYFIGLNVVYGVMIGLTIALGSSLITRAIFKSDKVYENPTRYFIVAMLSVTGYILVAMIFVNYFWFSLTQGVTVQQFLSSNFIMYTLASELILGLLIYLVALSRYFTRDLQRYYKRVAEIEGQLSKYRYDTLKNQLNPHFLFNALNTLSGLIYVDKEKADEFTHRLSKLYRYVLDVQKVEVVPISTEMDLVHDFLYLNNIRFNDHIKTTFHIENKEGYVVPMAIQLLLENAIKHNKISAEAPLQIEVLAKGNRLTVRNNIQLKQEKEPSHELGISNLRERYAALSDQGIEIEETERYFTVHIPILERTTA